MRKLLFLALLCPFLSQSQQPTLKPISVGEMVPPEMLASLPKTRSAKILVLDFFATWCGSCLKELPRLQQMQKDFSGEISVILITYEDAEKIKQLRKKNRFFSKCSLPVICSDTSWSQLFPHNLLPHTALVRGKGSVLAITDASDVTQENIRLLLSGAKLQLPQKIDRLNYNRNQPLLANGNGGSAELILFRSLLAKHLPGVPSAGGSSVSPDSATLRLYFTNRSVLSLYQYAVGRSLNSALVLELPETTTLLSPATNKKEWYKQHTYCYELTVPASTTPARINKFMLNDLNTYFQLNARFEKRSMNCYIISEQGTATAPAGRDSINITSLVKQLNNRLADGPLKPIILNECKTEHYVSRSLLEHSGNIKNLDNQLRAMGLYLRSGQRTLEVFVLSPADAQ